MNVTFYKNHSDKIVVDKVLTQVGVTISNASIKENISITDPVFTLHDFTGFNPATCNYVYIDTLNRYYYITDIRLINGSVYEVYCHVDVLNSFASGIRGNTAVIARQKNLGSLYYQDGVFKTKAYSKYDIIQFPNGFNGFHYVLTVAGA